MKTWKYPTVDEMEVSVDYFMDEFISNYSSFFEFSDDSEFDKVLIINTDATVKDFNFLEIQIDYDGHDYIYNIENTLYSIDELAPEKPLVISGVLGAGLLNVRGISFTNEEGVERFFYIQVSGDDGSLNLVEFHK